MLNYILFSTDRLNFYSSFFLWSYSLILQDEL